MQYTLYQQVDPGQRQSGPVRKCHTTPNCAAIRSPSLLQEVIRYDSDPGPWKWHLCRRCKPYLRGEPSTPEEVRAVSDRILAGYGITKNHKRRRTEPSTPEEFRAEFERIRAGYMRKTDADPEPAGSTP